MRKIMVLLFIGILGTGAYGYFYGSFFGPKKETLTTSFIDGEQIYDDYSYIQGINPEVFSQKFASDPNTAIEYFNRRSGVNTGQMRKDDSELSFEEAAEKGREILWDSYHEPSVVKHYFKIFQEVFASGAIKQLNDLRLCQAFSDYAMSINQLRKLQVNDPAERELNEAESFLIKKKDRFIRACVQGSDWSLLGRIVEWNPHQHVYLDRELMDDISLAVETTGEIKIRRMESTIERLEGQNQSKNKKSIQEGLQKVREIIKRFENYNKSINSKETTD